MNSILNKYSTGSYKWATYEENLGYTYFHLSCTEHYIPVIGFLRHGFQSIERTPLPVEIMVRARAGHIYRNHFMKLSSNFFLGEEAKANCWRDKLSKVWDENKGVYLMDSLISSCGILASLLKDDSEEIHGCLVIPEEFIECFNKEDFFLGKYNSKLEFWYDQNVFSTGWANNQRKRIVKKILSLARKSFNGDNIRIVSKSQEEMSVLISSFDKKIRSFKEIDEWIINITKSICSDVNTNEYELLPVEN